MYMLVAVIVIYIAGMAALSGISSGSRKRREQKKDEEFRRGDK